MVPTAEQIQVAAYYRWQGRGGMHGRDRDDWLAAEQELRFALNYRVIARHALDAPAGRVLGNAARPRCRFCEAGAPPAGFGPPLPVVPEALGNTVLFSAEVCGDCRETIEGLTAEFLRFARPFAFGAAQVGRLPSTVPIAAFKALVATGLLVLPEVELQYVEDAVEWVANPDHELDSTVLGPLECRVLLLEQQAPHPWVAVARRIDDVPLPYLHLSLGTGCAVFQAPLPMCVRDEDIEEAAVLIPEGCPSCLAGCVVDVAGITRLRLAPAPLARAVRLRAM